MSNRRIILLLLLAIAALVTAEILLRRSDAGRLASEQHTLLGRNFDIRRLELAGTNGAPVVLERGESWRIVAPFAGDALERKVLKILDDLRFMPVLDSKTDAELAKLGRTRAEMGLERPTGSVTASGRGFETRVVFGRLNPTGDGVYAAVAGAPAVFVLPTNILESVTVGADGLRRRSLFSLAEPAVVAFTLRRGHSPALEFLRTADGWTCDGARVQTGVVRNFVSTTLASEAVDFVWPTGVEREEKSVSTALLASYGFDEENAVLVSFKGASGQVESATLGKDFGSDRAYALVHDGTAVVTVDAALRKVASRGRSEFTDDRLFPVEAKEVLAYTLSDGEETCTLVRGGADAWRLETPVVAEADARFAEDTLAKILSLTHGDADDEGLSVSVATNLPGARVKTERVIGADGFSAFRSKSVAAFDPTLVRRLVRTDAQGAATGVEYSRERGSWNAYKAKAASAAADAENVRRVLAALNPLVAERVAKLRVPAGELVRYGLDRPFFTLAVDQDRDGAVRRNILVGAETEGGRFATVGASDAVFVISAKAVEELSLPLVDNETKGN